MATERPSSRSERLLRETLERNPPQPALTPSPRAHRRRHSHIPESTATSTSVSTEEDDQICRAAFLYRTTATASSPIRPHYHHHHHSQRPSPSPTRDYYSPDYSRSRSRAASPSHYRPSSPSPRGSRRQSLHRSPASADGYMTSALQRHNSTPARKRSAPSTMTSLPIDNPTLPLTPHEQVLRARLERVLIAGRVVDERERSSERHPYQHHYRKSSDTPGWPWSDPNLASTPPKSSSDHGHSQQYIINPIQSYQEQHYRSRSKTDPLTSPPLPPTTFAPRRATTSLTTPAPSSPRLLPHSKPRQYYSSHSQSHRHNSNSITSTPPLTADASPVLSEPHDQLAGEEVVDDVRLLLTPPPTPLYGASSGTATATHTPGPNSRRPPGVPMYRSRTGESYSSSTHASPYMYRREADGSVEQLDLGLGYPHGTATFNARKASERCRMMEGYVSFAQVEGLGMPPNGVDDDDSVEDGKRRKSGGGDGGEKRGRGLIGTWARKLFVAVQS